MGDTYVQQLKEPFLREGVLEGLYNCNSMEAAEIGMCFGRMLRAKRINWRVLGQNMPI